MGISRGPSLPAEGSRVRGNEAGPGEGTVREPVWVGGGKRPASVWGQVQTGVSTGRAAQGHGLGTQGRCGDRPRAAPGHSGRDVC